MATLFRSFSHSVCLLVNFLILNIVPVVKNLLMAGMGSAYWKRQRTAYFIILPYSLY